MIRQNDVAEGRTARASGDDLGGEVRKEQIEFDGPEGRDRR